MDKEIDLKRILSTLNISKEEFADNFDIRYCDMTAMLRGDIPVSDTLIGKLYRKYGINIFF